MFISGYLPYMLPRGSVERMFSCCCDDYGRVFYMYIMGIILVQIC